MHTPLKRRLGASLAALAVTAGGLSLAPEPAHAAPAPRPVALTDAISWLSGRADAHGLLPGFDGTTPSITATADFAKSLDEVGSPARTTLASHVATAAIAALSSEDRASQEIAEGLWASELGGSPNAQLAADLADHISAGTETVQVPTTTYGPAQDYAPSTTYGATAAAASATGRLLDVHFNPYTGTDAQAWAVLALAGARAPQADAALNYLLAQQCDDGGFRSSFDAVDSDAQDCASAQETAEVELRSSSPDATASALISLSGLPSPSEDVTAAIGRAAEWLSAHQNADGGYTEPSTYGDYESANSAGLAARALILTGHTAEATRTVGLLRSLQISALAGCVSGRAADRGAVLYTQDNLDQALTEGLTDPNDVGSAVSVTSQSLAALAAVQASNPTPSLVLPVGVRSGSTAVARISGALAGDALCLTVAGKHRLLPAGTTTVTVTAPIGAASAAVSLQTATGATARATLRINTAKHLAVTAKKKVKRGKKLKVTVSGLWAGEKVTVKLGKRKLGTATANGAGKATLKKKVAKKTRIGKVKVTVTGAFANRTGSKKVKVTR